MSITSVGAIYATQSLLLQRIYIPGEDDSEINDQHVGAGETLQLVPITTYQHGGPAAVQAAIGTPTISGVCAVVDKTNTVIAKIMADPAIYTDPNGNTVISSDLAAVGDTWNGTDFLRDYAVYSLTTGVVSQLLLQQPINALPSASIGNGLVVARTLQVGQTIPKLASASV